MSPRHLPDERLVDLAVTGTCEAADREHLAGCLHCEARLTGFGQLLDETAATAEHESDAAFPAERLARQHARILHRLAPDLRAARVIAFPAASIEATVNLGGRSTTRLVAAAALAGLFVGVLADQALTHLPGDPRRSARPEVAPVEIAVAPTLTPVAATATVSEDEFLGQLEAAVLSAGPLSLRPLDRLTPSAWDVSR